MSRQIFKSEIIKDIYGNRWAVTKRVDSGYGFDLLYGWPPEEAEANWKRQHGVPHIVDTKLETFILADLAGFLTKDIPITSARKQILRRIISSRRYTSLKDWEQNRDPNEEIFYLHGDHIRLPKIRDIEGRLCDLTAVKYFRPGFPIWIGNPIIPGKTPHGSGYILTKGLARFLFKTAHLSRRELAELGLPMNLEVQRRLRHRVVGHYRPDLYSFKATEDAERRRDMHLHPKYVKGAQVIDALGKLWRIHRIRETEEGDIILRGAPLGETQHPGLEYILTREIAALFDVDRGVGSHKRLAERLGIGPDIIGKMRAALGEGNPLDASDQWWFERIDDLLGMKPMEFAHLHECDYDVGAEMRQIMRYLLRCMEGMRRGLDYLNALRSDRASNDLAREFGFKARRTVTRHRKALRLLDKAGFPRPLTPISDVAALATARHAQYSPKRRKEIREYPVIEDAYGKTWLLLETRQTHYGISIDFGWPQPEDGRSSIDRSFGGHTLIVTETLRDFVLNDLEGFTQLDLPLSTTLKYRLRREISSRRFTHLRDWHSANLPEIVTYIDADLVDGAVLQDVAGQSFRVEQIRRAPNGMALYSGTEVGKRSGGGLIVTHELATFVSAAPRNTKALLRELGLKEKALRRLLQRIEEARPSQ